MFFKELLTCLIVKEMANIGINGFGRIGKQFFMAALKSKGKYNFFINDLADLDYLVYSLNFDSVHPTLKNVRHDGKNIIIGKMKIPVYHETDPAKLPWKKHKIDVAVECTGLFTHKKDAEKHIKAGAKKVLISAPGKNVDATIIYKINNEKVKSEKIISAGSCTTNAVAPLVKVLNDNWKIESSYFMTTHSYTSTQNLIDGHNRKSFVRGRAAAQNIIPTTSGASVSVAEGIPELKGKLDGYALRVPVVDGSFVTVVAKLKKKTSVEGINKTFKKLSTSSWKKILGYCDKPLVSQDIINNEHSCIVEPKYTKVQGDLVTVAAWYDNEYGYSHRLVDVLELMLKRK